MRLSLQHPSASLQQLRALSFGRQSLTFQAVCWQEEGVGTTCSPAPSMSPATRNRDLSGTEQTQRAQHNLYSSTVRLDISNSDSCSLVLFVHNFHKRVIACTKKLLLNSSLCSQRCLPHCPRAALCARQGKSNAGCRWRQSILKNSLVGLFYMRSRSENKG